ncbi:MAG: helix-turn-helix transcriptional regulator [Kangiellaceae bacterium]|nr:helix-turn-helix transcriptional regulator [Kangiellaceae bacterium]
MKRTEHNDKPCSIAQTLGIIGDSWTLLILRNCFLKTRRFADFQQQLGLTRHLLSDRLSKLVDNDILNKVPYGKSGKRFEYRLTAKGASLAKVFIAMNQWGNDWLFEEGSAPTQYEHLDCGQVMQPDLSCSECGGKINHKNIKMVVGDSIKETMRTTEKEQWNELLGFAANND